MSDTENKCLCDCLSEEEKSSLSGMSQCVKEYLETTVRASIKAALETALKHGCGCDCGEPTDPTDPVDPTDPTDPTDPVAPTYPGAGELLDTVMTSDAGNAEFTPFASSLYDVGGYAIWKSFQSGTTKDMTDCWCSNAVAPQHIGVTMKGGKYVITKVELVTRSSIPYPPKEFNLKYLDANGQWVDLTDHQYNTVDKENMTLTINVPVDRRVPTSGIRADMHSVFSIPNVSTSGYVVMGRMRIYGMKVS